MFYKFIIKCEEVTCKPLNNQDHLYNSLLTIVYVLFDFNYLLNNCNIYIFEILISHCLLNIILG